MRHFMYEGLANLLVGLIDESIRVEGELVVAGLVDAAGEAIGCEVSERMGFSLVRYKDVWQRAFEQCGIEVVERLLQPAVFDRRDGARLVDRSFVRLVRRRQRVF